MSVTTFAGHQAPPVSPKSISDAEAEAMYRAAERLIQLWHLTDVQAATLLGLPVLSYRRDPDKDHEKIDEGTKARLSNLIGIHKALRIIFTDPSRAYQWIGAANEAFDGRSALDVMLSGEMADLISVRRYLEASIGDTCWAEAGTP